MSATRIIYEAAGSPAIATNVQGQCRTCGEFGAGISFSGWVKDTFTNHDLLHEGEIVCAACLFCFDDKSESLQRKLGRDRPQKMRNYSHFVLGGEWHPLSKAEKVKMRELLSRDPQVAAISDSGQKHLAFRARVGWWQFEEHAMLPCWSRLENLLPSIEELLNGGFSKSEIENANYAAHRIQKFGLSRWWDLAEPLRSIAKADYFQLAMFLAQKDDADGATAES